MIQKIKERVQKTALWKWGGQETKNGWNAVAYIILFVFAFYAQLQTYDISKQNTKNSEAVLEVQSELLYEIQLGDYQDCLRAEKNQQNVKQYNKRVLDFAAIAGVDVQSLYDDLETLFIPPPECIVPVPLDEKLNKEKLNEDN